MSLGVFTMAAGMAVIALTGVGFLIWGLTHGQFKDVEEPKYRMLEDREPQPWPKKKKSDKKRR